ncbi:MAG: recombination protein RecR [Chlamydiae bacterium]|nr:recombination protein RecR [Chlamydiota bacterium]MBI3266636.1 recombination protein RecR [Chlamydiota bacterium]
MTYKLDAFQDMVEAFKLFPGIGTKTAERMAIFLLKSPLNKTQQFAQTLVTSKTRIRPCLECYLFTEEEICSICQDEKRDRGLICVIEEAKDALMIEKSVSFHGLYHVLMGKLSPLDGVGPENLKVESLLERVRKLKVREVILATGTDVEGEATALYLGELLEEENISVTRIAYGLPVGMGLDYADELTLARALEARRAL